MTKARNLLPLLFATAALLSPLFAADAALARRSEGWKDSAVPRAGTASRLPTAFRRGVTMAGYTADVFADPATLAALPRMASAGVRWVSVVVTWYQVNLQSTSLFRTASTASDESLRVFVRAAHAQGLSVLLKPHVDVQGGGWRGNINPSDRSAWFSSYSSMMEGYARLAQEEGVEALCVGTEFKSLESETTRWKQVIAATRALYDGALTYAANYDSYAGVFFFDSLDWVGIDAYFPVADDNTPTVDSLVNRWRGHLDAVQAWRSNRGLTSKPVVFTEVGYTSADGTAIRPWWFPHSCESVKVDMGEQRDAYKALFRAVRERSWMGGTFLWWWDNPSTSDYKGNGPDWRCFYTPRGKPAFKALKSAYR